MKGLTCKVSHCDRQEDKSHIFSRRPFIYASSALKEPIDHGEMTILTHFWPRYQITTLGSKSFIFWHTWIMDDRKSELKTVNKVWMHINFFPFFTVDGVYEILLWPFNEFPILFQRWLIIPSEFFNMWNFEMTAKVSHFNSDFVSRALLLDVVFWTIRGNLAGSNLRKSELPFFITFHDIVTKHTRQNPFKNSLITLIKI